MNREAFDHIYSAVATLADVAAVAGELAEYHSSDRSARVFAWICREADRARENLALYAEGAREGADHA